MNRQMPDFKPDQYGTWTPKKAEAKLPGFHFDGAGWYIYKDGVVLVIAIDRPPGRTVWYQKTDPTERFEFNIYKCNPVDCFNAIINAPTRVDQR